MATMTDSDVALLQALADPNRLAIVRKLVQEGEAGVVATTRQGTSIRCSAASSRPTLSPSRPDD
jgi:DNA-binding transcriptional ArsR family regulator